MKDFHLAVLRNCKQGKHKPRNKTFSFFPLGVKNVTFSILKLKRQMRNFPILAYKWKFAHMRRNKFHCCSGLRHSSPSPALQHCWTYSCDLIRWFPLATRRHKAKQGDAVTHWVLPLETLGYNYCIMPLVY